MLRYDVVLFDVDGTLIHSKPGIIQTLQYTFDTLGADVSGTDLNRYIGPPLTESFSNHFDTKEKVLEAQEVYRVRYKQIGQHQCSLFAGVPEMLSALKAAGLTLCTATCKPVPVVTPILKEQGIYDYFTVVGGATMDGTVGTKTEVIRSVLEDERFAGKRILMVGDRDDDMKGAKANGLPVAGALYGYPAPGELEAFDTVCLAASCEELTKYILQQV